MNDEREVLCRKRCAQGDDLAAEELLKSTREFARGNKLVSTPAATSGDGQS